MKQDSDTQTLETDLAWLKNDDPEIYHLLRALDGALDALHWLKLHGDGLFLFVEALSGAKEAMDALQDCPASKLVDLFDTIRRSGVQGWLSENHAELHALFAYVRGDADALKGIKPKKAVFKRIAEIVREKYRNYREEDADGLGSPAFPSPKLGEGKMGTALPQGAAADLGCLVGEMHLNNREYHKAIEAFSRALANDPTPDAYAGRARAYRALAALDDQAAAQLSERK